MADKWRQAPLSELAHPDSPITYGVVKPGKEDANGVLFIRGGDIVGGRVLVEQLRTITSEVSQQYRRTQLYGGEIIVSLVGNPGQVAIVPDELKGANIARQVGLVRLRHDVDARYVKYFLSSPKGQEGLGAHSLGSVQQVINLRDLKTVVVPIPPLQEQRAIAHILGTLDDKIELNRKQNETLEGMARALFKAWFVDFEPVRAKMEGRWQRGQSLPGLPAHLYDLFPDRLVESELGEIPEGWRVFSFGDVAQQGKGAVNPTDEPGERFTHYSIPAFDASKMPVIELGGSIKSNKTPVPDGAVLVSKLNPHIPRVWLVGQAGDRAVCSTEFIVWAPKPPANSAFLYCLASSSEFVESMCQLVTGTSNSHQRVKPDQLREIRVFAANENVIAAFSKMAESLMNQVLQNSLQSRTLAQLRDTLLPKLISGELRVPNAERIVGGLAQ
ncbi:MAG: restriction endonuclease subunit S [Tepidimonas ignava]|uniref:restriction endonuclease subunit S n=1 Tax=Tepidimonas ignava TaxID=114249 RepID=UPI00391BF1E4